MKFVAFLQGISFGRYNRIDIPDLMHHLESRGLKNLHTIYHSANLIFEAEYDANYLKTLIEREIMVLYRLAVPVIVRSVSELEAIVSDCPFSREEIKQAKNATGENVYVVLLNKDLSVEKQELLEKLGSEDRYIVKGREIYLLFLDRLMRLSPLVQNIKQVDVYAIIKDLKTIKKLVQHCRQM